MPRNVVADLPRSRRHVASESSASVVSYEVKNKVARICINNPPVNSFTLAVYNGLVDTFRQAHSNPDVQAIILYGNHGKFMAGADIPYIQQLQKKALQGETDEMKSFILDGHKLVNDLIENGAKPTVAAINGMALGGGLELAMSCNARVAVNGTVFGLPELRLGLIPGLGGTQRLPRLVGLQKSLEMILKSQNVKASDALQLGLIDACVESESTLLDKAEELALALGTGARPRVRTLTDLSMREDAATAKMILKMARKMATKALPPNASHVEALLQSVEAGVLQGGVKGDQVEAAQFLQIGAGLGAQALVHLFLAQQGTKKVSGISDLGLKPRPIKEMAVIGGGLMGSGIATAALMKGIRVVLKEVDETALNAGVSRITKNLQKRLNSGKMSQQKYDAALEMLKPTLKTEDLASVSLVVEAVVENLKVKQAIFADVEKVVDQDCILATNTSTIDILKIAEHLSDKSRMVGAHFFSPAHVMPLLEIVASSATAPQVTLDLLGFAQTLGKTPVVVGNCIGFGVNRMFFPYGQAAHLLVEVVGLDLYHIDKVMKDYFGMPMGPFRLSDLVGVDVYTFVNGIIESAYGSRTYTSPMAPALLQAGRYGEKSGKGYYVIDPTSRQAQADPEIAQFVEDARAQARSSLTSSGLPAPEAWTKDDIVAFILFPVVNEACRVLEENMANKAADLDIASVFGMGFPATRGGLFKWADSLGSKHIHDTLVRFQALHPSFFEPSALLRQMSANNATFY